MKLTIKDKIHLHPSIWMTILLSVTTGMFVEMTIIFAIVLWHESGHAFAAALFKWKIRRITIWLFGGVMETEEHINKPIYQQLLVTLAGPIQHLFIFMVLLLLSQLSAVPDALIDFALIYNGRILVFNLIPIWPLDGGKLTYLVLMSYLPFKKAHEYTIILSISILCVLFSLMLIFHAFLLNTFVLVTFLLWENRLEWKRRLYVFQRFLIMRRTASKNTALKKLIPLKFHSQTRLLDVFSSFRASCYHPIMIVDHHMLVTESVCFTLYFDQGGYRANLADLIKQ
ncbi:stage IV sporulation protein FB [Amphibacillus marinus]|uniref:Stage IV sporulation protein FB n=1 Tax=Amphibacillus marinus TaxID=872970 RepID=A0A1H8P1V2_9BACI|nr:site-2 protease family protein [Amphibacillus marinus]SEO35926.1 stage IV sporulation protein FB [Amphibacillus marinus]